MEMGRWYRVNGDTYNSTWVMMVLGGWLVRHEHHSSHRTESMVFLADEHHDMRWPAG